MSSPIYYVIVEDALHPSMMPIFRIHKVFSCDLTDIDAIWRREGVPLLATNPRLSVMIFQREPDNPFRKMAEEK